MSVRATQLSQGMFRRLLLGIGSSGLGQIIAAVQAIMLVPLFLHAWGSDTYGHWLGLLAFVSYLNLLDLGGQNYIGNLLALDYAQNNLRAFQKKLSEGVSLFTFLAIIVFSLLALGLFGAAILALPGLSLSFETAWVILAAAVAALLSVPGGVYVTAYRATGRFARGMMVGNVLRLMELGFYALLLVLKMPPTIYATGLMLGAATRITFITFDTRRAIPACRQIKLSLGLAWSGRQYLKGSVQFWFLTLATNLNQQGVLIVLSTMTNPLLVAVYATHRTAAGLVGYLSNLLQAPLWTELSFLWAKNRQQDLQRLVLLAIKFVLLVSGLAALSLWLSLPVIYPIWTGKQLHFDLTLMAILLVQVVLAGGWSTTSWPLLATNKHSKIAFWALSNGIVTIVLACCLTPLFGLIGVACATLAGDILCGFLVFPGLCARLLKISIAYIYWVMCRVVIVLAPLVAIALLLTHFLQNWQLLISFGLAALVWTLPGLRIVLNNSELQSLTRKFKLSVEKA